MHLQEIIEMAYRKFAQGFAQEIQSNRIKLAILAKIVSHILPIQIDLPVGPLDEQIRILFDIIRFNTPNRYNEMLFFTNLYNGPFSPNFTNIIVFVNKVSETLFALHYNVDDAFYKDTLFDGVLIQDSVVYEPDFQTLLRTGGIVTEKDIDFDIEEYYVPTESEESEEIDQSSETTGQTNKDDQDGMLVDEISLSEDDEEREIMTVARCMVDDLESLDQQTKTNKWIYYICDVTSFKGITLRKTIAHEKYILVNHFLASYNRNTVLENFEMFNFIHGTFHRAQSAQQSQNPQVNDYTYFHNKIPQFLSYNGMLGEQYEMNPMEMKNVAFEEKLVKFEIRRSQQYPYIFDLFIGPRKEMYGNACMPTAECNLYCADLTRKMKPPIIVKCLYNYHRKGWTPIEHAYGENAADDRILAQKIENKLQF